MAGSALTAEEMHSAADAIVDHYTEVLGEALASVFSLSKIEEAVAAVAALNPPTVAQKSALPGKTVRATVQKVLNGNAAVAKLTAVLHKLRIDGFIFGAVSTAVRTGLRHILGHMVGHETEEQATAGTEEALRAMLHAPADDDFWSKWEPGWQGAADVIEQSGGLAKLLNTDNATVAGLVNTTIDQIGTKIMAGLAAGDPHTKVAKDVQKLIGADMSRCKTIANTEYARAMTVASYQTYTENDIDMVRWLAEKTACPRCAENAAASPVPLHGFPNGDVPAHPNCRCAIVPDEESILSVLKSMMAWLDEARDKFGKWTEGSEADTKAVEAEGGKIDEAEHAKLAHDIETHGTHDVGNGISVLHDDNQFHVKLKDGSTFSAKDADEAAHIALASKLAVVHKLDSEKPLDHDVTKFSDANKALQKARTDLALLKAGKTYRMRGGVRVVAGPKPTMAQGGVSVPAPYRIHKADGTYQDVHGNDIAARVALDTGAEARGGKHFVSEFMTDAQIAEANKHQITEAQGHDTPGKPLVKVGNEFKSVEPDGSLSDHMFQGYIGKAPNLPKLKKPIAGVPAAKPKVETLGGATGAKLLHLDDGSKVVVKQGGAPAEEYAADEVYRKAEELGLMGKSHTPESALVDVGGKKTRFSKFIEHTTPLHMSPTPSSAFKSVQSGFAVDALLRNWDAPGMQDNNKPEASNILMGADGTVHRIDSGGAFDKTALGGQKPGGFENEWPSDIWTMRDPHKAVVGHKVFGSLPFSVIVGQMSMVGKNFDTLAKAVPEEAPTGLKIGVAGRARRMGQLADAAKTMHEGGMEWGEIDSKLGKWVQENPKASKDALKDWVGTQVNTKEVVAHVTTDNTPDVSDSVNPAAAVLTHLHDTHGSPVLANGHTFSGITPNISIKDEHGNAVGGLHTESDVAAHINNAAAPKSVQVGSLTYVHNGALKPANKLAQHSVALYKGAVVVKSGSDGSWYRLGEGTKLSLAKGKVQPLRATNMPEEKGLHETGEMKTLAEAKPGEVLQTENGASTIVKLGGHAQGAHGVMIHKKVPVGSYMGTPLTAHPIGYAGPGSSALTTPLKVMSTDAPELDESSTPEPTAHTASAPSNFDELKAAIDALPGHKTKLKLTETAPSKTGGGNTSVKIAGSPHNITSVVQHPDGQYGVNAKGNKKVKAASAAEALQYVTGEKQIPGNATGVPVLGAAPKPAAPEEPASAEHLQMGAVTPESVHDALHKVMNGAASASFDDTTQIYPDDNGEGWELNYPDGSSGSLSYKDGLEMGQDLGKYAHKVITMHGGGDSFEPEPDEEPDFDPEPDDDGPHPVLAHAKANPGVWHNVVDPSGNKTGGVLYDPAKGAFGFSGQLKGGYGKAKEGDEAEKKMAANEELFGKLSLKDAPASEPSGHTGVQDMSDKESYEITDHLKNGGPGTNVTAHGHLITTMGSSGDGMFKVTPPIQSQSLFNAPALDNALMTLQHDGGTAAPKPAAPPEPVTHPSVQGLIDGTLGEDSGTGTKVQVKTLQGSAKLKYYPGHDTFTLTDPDGTPYPHMTAEQASAKLAELDKPKPGEKHVPLPTNYHVPEISIHGTVGALHSNVNLQGTPGVGLSSEHAEQSVSRLMGSSAHTYLYENPDGAANGITSYYSVKDSSHSAPVGFKVNTADGDVHHITNPMALHDALTGKMTLAEAEAEPAAQHGGRLWTAKPQEATTDTEGTVPHFNPLWNDATAVEAPGGVTGSTSSQGAASWIRKHVRQLAPYTKADQAAITWLKSSSYTKGNEFIRRGKAKLMPKSDQKHLVNLQKAGAKAVTNKDIKVVRSFKNSISEGLRPGDLIIDPTPHSIGTDVNSWPGAHKYEIHIPSGSPIVSPYSQLEDGSTLGQTNMHTESEPVQGLGGQVYRLITHEGPNGLPILEQVSGAYTKPDNVLKAVYDSIFAGLLSLKLLQLS